MSTRYHFSCEGQEKSFYNINGNGIYEGYCSVEARTQFRTFSGYSGLVMFLGIYSSSVGLYVFFRLEGKPFGNWAYLIFIFRDASLCVCIHDAMAKEVYCGQDFASDYSFSSSLMSSLNIFIRKVAAFA